jgi:glycosyltransferase involved in cell wall biosynthesis
MSLVLVPSHSTASELAEKGIAREKIRVFPRGVDTNLFHPARRNGSLDAICKAPNALKMLYVGRISREKNLEVLARVFRSLIESGKNVSLIVVGDGPYREQMEQTLRDTPSVFTGYVQGEALASIYASSDLFVFPSTTDTFGNVILEAQASGLPVVVTDCGGPQENMIHGETGIVVAGKNEVALLEAIAVLLDDPDRLKRMGRTARELVERRTFDGAFEQTWQLYADVSEHEKPR